MKDSDPEVSLLEYVLNVCSKKRKEIFTRKEPLYWIGLNSYTEQFIKISTQHNNSIKPGDAVLKLGTKNI